MTKQDYDNFSKDYDRFVNWKERLSAEMPFIKQQLGTIRPDTDQPLRVLDSACGTGMHAIALAEMGYRVSAADISSEMIKKARENAHVAQQDVDFKSAGFGDLAHSFISPSQPNFDALFCLGNSLPHLLSENALQTALEDMAACLRPGGLLLLQNRNFDAVMSEHNRWQGIQSYQEDRAEWLFVRFYDFDPDGLITFNIIHLQKNTGETWRQEISTTRLFPLKQDILLPLLKNAGFGSLNCYGKMGFEAFDAQKSGNLVITATKT
jgi:glycine/sarcosine N-methyltransferase